MNNQQYEDRLKGLDDETRPDRVRRWGEISRVAYIGELPELLQDYSAKVIQLYINGNFCSVILWCASILELVLADKLISEGKGKKEVIELLSLKEKTDLCRRYNIIDREESKKISKVRESRNAIVHANAGKLTEMAKKSYGDVSNDLSKFLAGFFLSNLGGGIQSQALEYLEFTRTLSARWYGENPTDAHSSQG